MKLAKSIKTGFRLLTNSILIVLAVFIFFYLKTKIYDFPDTKKFSGNEFYNPYQGLDSNTNHLKANFHSHSKLLTGLTSGEDSQDSLASAYKREGYDFLGISNYFTKPSISEENTMVVSMYEHGFNPFKSHRLVFLADNIHFFDYPLFQTSSHKQEIINHLRENSQGIAIAHPSMRNGHSKSDMKKLVGYDFIEVGHPHRLSTEYWDAALSEGRLSWLLSNDDCHDTKSNLSFTYFNYILSEKLPFDDVLIEMKKGKMYGVSSMYNCDIVKLEKCKMNGDTIQVKFDQVLKQIDFIGDNGKLIKRSELTDNASLIFPHFESYIRIEGHHVYCSAYLNPIVRWNGQTLRLASTQEVEVNTFKTYLFRFIIVILLSVLIFMLFKFNKRT